MKQYRRTNYKFSNQNNMDKNRLEAFSDGVIAIIITIMVLELKVPHNPTLTTYLEAYPIFISYALSFLFVGLYWSNHHHLFYKASNVNNKILWVNTLGLFWLSLIPFSTGSMGENSFTSITVTIYAFNLILCVISYMLLARLYPIFKNLLKVEILNFTSVEISSLRVFKHRFFNMKWKNSAAKLVK